MTADNSLVNNFQGGLNTASPLNAMPRGDSPLVHNVYVTDEGTARTRKGTYLSQLLENPDAQGVTVIPFVTDGGNSMLLCKFGRDLYIYPLYSKENDAVVCGQPIIKYDVWDVVAAREKVISVRTFEKNSRIIMCCPSSPPIQLTFVQYSQRVLDTYFEEFEVRGAEFYYANADNALCWCEGRPVPISYFSDSGSYAQVYLAEYFDLSLTNPTKQYTDVDTVYVSWQWACQASIVVGSYLYDTVTRFNTAASDKTVAIPPLLYANVDDIPNGYPIIAYRSNTRADYLSYSPKPTTSFQYSFSAGIYYDPASSGIHVPNFTHLSFGGLTAGTEENHLIRGFKVDSYHDDIFTEDTLDLGFFRAFVNLDSETIGSNPTTDRFLFRREDNFQSDASITNTYDEDLYITADGTADFGLAGSDIIEFWYTRPTHVGSGAQNSTSSLPRDGYPVPYYGIQEHADYHKRSYPSVVSVFQGRLIFSGFRHYSGLVSFSESFGSNLLGRNFQSFQVGFSFVEEPFKAFSVVLSQVNESVGITHVTESNGNVIVFTKDSVHRIFSNEGPLRITNFIVSRLANMGCVNPHSAVTVDNAVYFLSLYGLKRLSPAIQVGSFQITNYGEKVNNRLNHHANIKHASITFDKVRGHLYLAVCRNSIEHSDTLYFLNTTSQAFSEFAHFTQSWITRGMCNVYIDDFSYVMFVCGLPYSGDLYILSHPYDFNTDFSLEGETVETITSGGYGGGTETVQREFYYPSIRYVYTQAASVVDRVQEFGEFRSSVDNFPQFEILFDGISLRFGDQWFSFGDKFILNVEFFQGNQFDIYPVDDRGLYPLVVYLNNKRTEEYTDSSHSPFSRVITYEGEDGDVIRTGMTIPYILSTPKYVEGNLIGTPQNLTSTFLLRNGFYQKMFADGSWRTNVGGRVSKLFDLPDIIAGGVYDDEYRFDVKDFDFSGDQQFKRESRIAYAAKGSDHTLQILLHTFSDKGFEVECFQSITLSSKRKP